MKCGLCNGTIAIEGTFGKDGFIYVCIECKQVYGKQEG